MDAEITALQLEHVESIKCAICWELLDIKDTIIVRLPCSHVYCYNCFEGLPQTRCPLCRATFSRKTYLGNFGAVATQYLQLRSLDMIIQGAMTEFNSGGDPLDEEPLLPMRRPRRRRRSERQVERQVARRRRRQEIVEAAVAET